MQTIIPSKRRVAWLLTGVALGASGCVAPVDDDHPSPRDARLDDAAERADALLDAGTDARLDAAPDTGPDARLDAAPDAGPDARLDAAPDAAMPDAEAADAVPDASPADAALDAEPDATPAELDPFLPDDPAPCALRPIDRDLPGGYALLPAPLGVVAWVGDPDGDGRAELHALTAVEERPAPGAFHRTHQRTVFDWRDGAFVERGVSVGFVPYTPIVFRDFPALLGSVQYVDPRDEEAPITTLGVRLDAPRAALRYDTLLDLFGLRPDSRLPDFFAPLDAAVFDSDGDGHVEVLTFNGVILEDGDRGFAPVWRVDEADPLDEARGVGGGTGSVLAHGDFDGDGRYEFVLGEHGPSVETRPGVRSTTGRLRVFENDGDDTWRLRARLPIWGNPFWYNAAGDLDGDGRPEFVSGDAVPFGCARFQVWRSPADDTYTRMAAIDFMPARGLGDRNVTVFADLDGDGDDELVASLGDVITAWDWDGEDLVQILGYDYCPAGCNPPQIFTGDLDGDGRAEIVFRENTNEEIRDHIWLSPTGVRVLRRVDR